MIDKRIMYMSSVHTLRNMQTREAKLEIIKR